MQTSLFFDLSQTHFKDLIAHPLCQAFLEDKCKKEIWYFVIFIMVPHFVFSLIYSIYSGALLGHLCAMNDTDGRWELTEEIPCGQIDETTVRLSLRRLQKILSISNSGQTCLDWTNLAHHLPLHLCWQRVDHHDNIISLPSLYQKISNLQEHCHHHLHRFGHLQPDSDGWQHILAFLPAVAIPCGQLHLSPGLGGDGCSCSRYRL